MFDSSLILSIITAATAVIALYFSHASILSSNKQYLFDKRINIWLSINEMMQQCKYIPQYLDEPSKPILTTRQLLLCLTNINEFKNIINEANIPIDKLDLKSFNKKCEDIERMSIEVKMIFKRKGAKAMEEFLLKYYSVLSACLLYEFILKESQKNQHLKKKEEYYRTKLHTTISELMQAYNILENTSTIKKIEQQIRLSKR